VTLDNRARGPGRYALWSTIDLDRSPRVKPLIDLLLARKTVVSPTLAVFEARRGDRGATDERVRGYETMLRFVGLCHRAGVPLVVGSHSLVPKAERGWAYHREMELLAECGLTPLEVISAATRNNAAIFRVADRLGTVEPGKQADLVLIDGDPMTDIKTMRHVRGVMRGGRWVTPPASK
jgi:imidazolonepropionase-like amidohydrolase